MSFKRTFILFWMCFTILIFYSGNVIGQSCRKYHENLLCKYEWKTGFRLSGQTRSTRLVIGEPSNLRVILYGGYDYVIATCTESGYAPIHYKLVDNGTGEIIYDNLDHDYVESVGFTVDQTQTIDIEVGILGEKVRVTDFDQGTACVSVIILWRKTPKIGF